MLCDSLDSRRAAHVHAHAEILLLLNQDGCSGVRESEGEGAGGGGCNGEDMVAAPHCLVFVALCRQGATDAGTSASASAGAETLIRLPAAPARAH